MVGCASVLTCSQPRLRKLHTMCTVTLPVFQLCKYALVFSGCKHHIVKRHLKHNKAQAQPSTFFT